MTRLLDSHILTWVTVGASSLLVPGRVLVGMASSQSNSRYQLYSPRTDTTDTPMEPHDPTCAAVLPGAPSLSLGSMLISYTHTLDFDATAQTGQCSHLSLHI